MHRSNNSSPYPLFERLFAVILSVTDIKEITFGGCIAEVIPKKTPALTLCRGLGGFWQCTLFSVLCTLLPVLLCLRFILLFYIVTSRQSVWQYPQGLFPGCR